MPTDIACRARLIHFRVAVPLAGGSNAAKLRPVGPERLHRRTGLSNPKPQNKLLMNPTAPKHQHNQEQVKTGLWSKTRQDLAASLTVFVFARLCKAGCFHVFRVETLRFNAHTIRAFSSMQVSKSASRKPKKYPGFPTKAVNTKPSLNQNDT